MRNLFILFSFLSLIFIFGSCYTSKPVYSLKITEIEKNKTITNQFTIIDSLTFQDTLIKVVIEINDLNQYLKIKIKNNTMSKVIVEWDQAYFQSINGVSKVMIIDDVDEQIIPKIINEVSDTIISKMIKTTYIMPFNNINWHYWTNTSGTWNLKDLISSSNDTIILFLPIQINDQNIVYSIKMLSKYSKSIDVYDPPKAKSSYTATTTVLGIIATILLLTLL